MRLLLTVFMMLIFLTAHPSLSLAEDQQDPIDQALERCLDGPAAQTTVGQIDCADVANKAWNQELIVVERALMARLDEESQALLRDAQQKWHAYRDADFAFLGGPWTQDLGTIVQVIAAASAVDRVRERVMILRGYLELLGEN